MLCPVGSTGLIIKANEEIEVRRGMGHPEHIIVCSAEMEDKNSMRECGLATKATRAQSSGRALIIIAREAVVATRAQTSRASIDNSEVTRGGLCHKGAVIASEL